MLNTQLNFEKGMIKAIFNLILCFQGFVTANGIRVIKTDWSASNGLIQFVDQLIHPIARDNLKQVLENDGRFKTLLSAFEAAEMTDTLENNSSKLIQFSKWLLTADFTITILTSSK